jgi:hypothetical protein
MSEEESQVEDQSIIEVTDIGINTDELSPEELQKLVDNNKELHENEVINISHELKDRRLNGSEEENKEDLINDLIKKEKYFEMLSSYNIELKNKIEISNQRYKDVLEKIEEKKNEDTEGKLTNQIKEMEKEINANNVETERYKKKIDDLKKKIEFQTNLERAYNLQNVLKLETIKNNELKKQYNALLRVNGVQKKYIKNIDKENQITEKKEILKNEIKQQKEAIKEYQEKFTKQDRFLRLIHEKILSIEINIRKMKEPKIKETKMFTKEELKNTVDSLNLLKEQVTENRNQLNYITKSNDEKLKQIFTQNKKIEFDYKEAEKEHKRLLFKKNELKRLIKFSNINNNINKQSKKKIYLKQKEEEENRNDNNDYDNQELYNEKHLVENDNYDDVNDVHPKLFSKNPNKNKIEEYEDENNLDQPPDSNSMGDDNIDINDSNAEINNDSNAQINNNIKNNDDLL